MVPEDLVSRSEDLGMKMRCKLGCDVDEGIIEKRGGGIQEISVPLSQFRCKPQMLNYINRGIVK